MTMKDYTAAAQNAQDTLSPLLDKAVADAQKRLSEATKAASVDSLRPQLIAIIDNADTPPLDAVTGILSTYCALMPQHRTREGDLLVRSLCSTKKHHGLTDKQAAQVAGAMVACVQGKAPMSLIEWPDVKTWHRQLNDADLHQWAEWVAPKEYATLSKALEKTTEARMSAETDVVQLETCRRALADLVPKAFECAVIQVRNNADHCQGVAGIQWEGGEVKRLEPTDYAKITVHPGFSRLIEQAQLEVVI